MSCSCGPDWLPNKLVHWYLAVPADEQCFFHDACVQHDLDYENGVPKMKADDDFLLFMLRLVILEEPTMKQVRRALAYYRWVKWGGYFSYSKSWTKRRLFSTTESNLNKDKVA